MTGQGTSFKLRQTVIRIKGEVMSRHILCVNSGSSSITFAFYRLGSEEELLERLAPEHVRSTDLDSEKIQTILTHAPGNGAPIGGLKVIAESGWFTARPSWTEDIYKIYAESFRGEDHLGRILEEAQIIVNHALAASPQQPGIPSKTNLKEKP
jgi:phosphoglucomutase